MHSQFAQTPTRLPASSTLIPATMQVDKNGERHLILHYPDGQTYATAFANLQGHIQLVPTTPAVGGKDIRLVPVTTTAAATEHNATRGVPQQFLRKAEVATHTHVISNKAGQRVELFCTCPPELHQAMRRNHEGTLQREDDTLRQTKPQPAYILADGHDAQQLAGGKWVMLGSIGEAVARASPPTANVAPLASPTGSSENCQESDSTDTTSGSDQIAFPSIRSGIPPDVLLASVLNEQIRRPTKPPQTLEEAQHRIAYMENQMAHLTAWVQAVQKGGLANAKLGDSTDGALTGKPSSPTETLTAYTQINEKVKNTDKCAETCDSFSQHSVNSCDPNKFCHHRTHPETQWTTMKRMQLISAFRSVCELRSDLSSIRRSHEANAYSFYNMSNSIMSEIKKLLRESSLGKASPTTALRLALDSQLHDYKSGCLEVETWLTDLDGCIEDLRLDALSRRCRVSVNEVETYALHLSRLSRRLASFKARIPDLRDAFTSIAPLEQAELRADAESLANEQKRLDMALSTCKQLTCTLFTLKRLGSVQKNGVNINIPSLRTIRDPRTEDKQLVLQQIKKIVPDHEARMLGLACYERTRERRKRMTNLRESVKFERAVEVSECQMETTLNRLNALVQVNQSSAESDSRLSVDIGGERTTFPSPTVDLYLQSRPQEVDDSEESCLETPSPSHYKASDMPNSTSPDPSSSSWVCPIHLATQHESEITAYSAADNHGMQNFDERGQNACCDFYKSVAQEIAKASYQHHSRSCDSSSGIHRASSSSGGRRARVVFSRTVLVGDGRETTRLNCPSDLDDDLESEVDERDHFDESESSGLHDEEGGVGTGRYQPWRRDQIHRGNKVVDIHPGLPRNQYIICDGRCGAPACAEGSCLARQRGNTGSVLKSTSSYSSSSSSSEKSAPPAPPPRLSSKSSSDDHLLTAADHAKTRDDEPTSVHEMRGHHHCCRLSGNPEIKPRG